MKRPSSFLFHVPGASDVLDTDGHFKYKRNYLSYTELIGMEDKPAFVEIHERDSGKHDKNSGKRLGRMDTTTALIKFSE